MRLNKGSSLKAQKSTKISFPVFWMRTPHSMTDWGRGCPTGFLSFGPFLKNVTNHQSSIFNNLTIRREEFWWIHRCLIYIFFLREHEAHSRWNIINWMTIHLPFQGGGPSSSLSHNLHLRGSPFLWLDHHYHNITLYILGGSSLLLSKLKSLTALTRLQGKLAFLFTIVKESMSTPIYTFANIFRYYLSTLLNQY